VLEIEVAERIAVNAIHRQHEHHGEVGNEQGQIEVVPMVKTAEGLVGILHFEVMAEAGLRRERQVCGGT